MKEHLKFLAAHVVKHLNELGIVKDAQVNATVTYSVVGAMNEYLEQQTLSLVLDKELARLRANDKLVADIGKS